LVFIKCPLSETDPFRTRVSDIEGVIEALHKFRFAGNAAAHDLDPLNREDAEVAIGIIEDLLNFLVDYKASQVRSASNRGSTKSRLVQ
jgi:Domain of unknown function (DUF4145)